jgi:CPA2 family monovalent cation:H+ antiporter-2
MEHAMHAIDFIQDLAVIMLIAGVVTLLFHHLRQPVVLGYLVAGVIIGPHTPPFALIHDQQTIATLAELGVVFLMFSLGLEFSIRKLARVGATAVVAALAEIVLMLWLGFEIGRVFGWSTMDAVFLGAMLAISSTTIIVKALDELGMKRERFAQLIFGILIVEDILAIGMIALLSGIAATGTLAASAVLVTLGQLALFLVVSLVVGILAVPRLLAHVARFQRDEMLLITVLALCFGFCLLVVRLGYSLALGAFVIGAVMAESRQLRAIERLTAPLTDMFSAIFFVAIGLMIDPRILVAHAVPIAVITLVVITGKVVSCSLGAFVGGSDGRTAMRVGMGLAQIGEFSFIIASLGVSLGVTSDFLYPIAVAVSAVTTFLTPYLIRAADPLSRRVTRSLPAGVRQLAGLYTAWLRDIRPEGDRAELARVVRRILLHVAVNSALAVAVFLAGGFFMDRIDGALSRLGIGRAWQSALVWGGALLVSLPFLIAVYRKLKALSMLLAELGVRREHAGAQTDRVRRVLAEVIPAAALVGILFLIAALSARILPPRELLLLVLVIAAALTAVLWRWFVKIHARLQVALLETLQAGGETR